MNTETNQDGGATEETQGDSNTGDSLSLSRKEYDELVRSRSELGSLKREYKDLKKSIDDKPEMSQKPDTSGLLEKQVQTLALKVAGIATPKEIELAERIQKETGLGWDRLLDSKYFKLELDELRTTEANVNATAGISGGGNTANPVESAAYWAAKGTPPTAEQVPNRKKRMEIVRDMMKNSSGSGKQFYND